MLHWCLFPTQHIVVFAWGGETILFLVFHFFVRPIFPFLIITFSVLRCLKIKLIRFFRPSIITFFTDILPLSSCRNPSSAILPDETNLSFEPRTHIKIFCKFELFIFIWVTIIGILILSVCISSHLRSHITVYFRRWRGIFAKNCIDIYTYFSYLTFFTKKILLHYCNNYNLLIFWLYFVYFLFFQENFSFCDFLLEFIIKV